MSKNITKPRLTRAEKRLIAAAIARAKPDRKSPYTAQETIPYERMYSDGICRVRDTYYTKTLQFGDVNYLLAQNEDKKAIFEAWCDFLNYFDPSVRFQFSFLNLSRPDGLETGVAISEQDDEYDSIRREYADMLASQLAKGNNGLLKTKYLTFGVEADTPKSAKPRLERIEADLIANFKRVGVTAEPLDGKARLRTLHNVFHLDNQEPFAFEWSWLSPSGLSTQDFIAPSSFDFRDKRAFCLGGKHCAVSYFQILAAELKDRVLADYLNMESDLVLSMHVQAVDQTEAIKLVKRKLTDLDSMKIAEQKKAVRSGYDMGATRSLITA